MVSKYSGLKLKSIKAVKVPPIFVMIKYILKFSKLTISVITKTHPSQRANMNAPQKSNS
jgi:hypothetical protein